MEQLQICGKILSQCNVKSHLSHHTKKLPPYLCDTNLTISYGNFLWFKSHDPLSPLVEALLEVFRIWDIYT